jgi:hypothetical protein
VNAAKVCAACRLLRDVGELLRADFREGRIAAICRPSVNPSCIHWAGPANDARIALLDGEAAARHDAERAAELRTPDAA